ncbi:MAG: hypothetical protein WC015_08010 [Methanoregula sp.]
MKIHVPGVIALLWRVSAVLTLCILRVCTYPQKRSGKTMKLLCVPVFVLAMALFAVLPVYADDSQGTVSGENTRDALFVTIDPIGEHYSGDIIPLRGTTNLPLTENLRVEVYSSSYHHNRNTIFYGISRAVPLQPGKDAGVNFWSTNVETKNWSPDEYLVTAFPDSDTGTHNRGYAGEVYNLLAGDDRPAADPLVAHPAILPVPMQSIAQVTPSQTTPPQQAPHSALITLTATGGVLILAGLCRNRRLT